MSVSSVGNSQDMFTIKYVKPVERHVIKRQKVDVARRKVAAYPVVLPNVDVDRYKGEGSAEEALAQYSAVSWSGNAVKDPERFINVSKAMGRSYGTGDIVKDAESLRAGLLAYPLGIPDEYPSVEVEHIFTRGAHEILIGKEYTKFKGRPIYGIPFIYWMTKKNGVWLFADREADARFNEYLFTLLTGARKLMEGSVVVLSTKMVVDTVLPGSEFANVYLNY
jgi:hypothetical protein